jgi:hypothetical protein
MRKSIFRQLRPLVAQLSGVQFEMCRISGERLISALEHEASTANIADKAHDFRVRLLDQSNSIFCLMLGTQDRDLYENALGEDGALIFMKFPSITYEIEEAAKCLALERATASVFHSIRSLEAAIRAMARCVGIADPTKGAERSWFKILDAIKGELDKRWQPSLIHNSDGRIFGELYAALAAIQNPWRNSTMHLDQKYTLEEARHIFEMVTGFMKKLASRCDEDGNPKA